MSGKKLRCAIYTRKSTDEGLEQSFNSLDAQYEACSAYILSQAGEGWTQLKERYDDGGYSGGSIERPGLKRLLSDIAARRVDVVVVYKVDRLTRALSDFARIVDILDEAGASFVSVTQAFNTTTSMGRLTLNVLLSFAQFEREVTGERIRDKIAASKAKGMWMGGCPPLGYDVRDRGLHVNESEAETVRAIFRRYLELPSTIAVRDELERTGVRSKSWVARTERPMGGFVFSRGGLNYLLRNRVYIGEVVHRGKAYPGQHQAIVANDLFDAAQQKLAAGAPAPRNIESRGLRPLLLGKLFDDRGNVMTSAHANKKAKRHFYYVSTAVNTGKPRGAVARVSAPKLEHALFEIIEPMLRADWQNEQPIALRVVRAIRRAVIHRDHVALELQSDAVDQSHAALRQARGSDAAIALEVPLKLGQIRRARTLVASNTQSATPHADRALIRAVMFARRWAEQIASGKAASLREIAHSEDVCPSYARQILPLAFLAPDLVEAIVDGRQPPRLSLAALIAQPLPPIWAEQRQLFARFG